MPIYDPVTDTPPTQEELTTIAANTIRRILRGAINGVDSRLENIRKQVARGGGKALVAAEIGADAPEMQAAYDDLKDFVETYSPTVVDPL